MPEPLRGRSSAANSIPSAGRLAKGEGRLSCQGTPLPPHPGGVFRIRSRPGPRPSRGCSNSPRRAPGALRPSGAATSGSPGRGSHLGESGGGCEIPTPHRGTAVRHRPRAVAHCPGEMRHSPAAMTHNGARGPHSPTFSRGRPAEGRGSPRLGAWQRCCCDTLLAWAVRQSAGGLTPVSWGVTHGASGATPLGWAVRPAAWGALPERSVVMQLV
jgi:hypothetical protein